MRLIREERRVDFEQICKCGSRRINRHRIRNDKQWFKCKECEKYSSVSIADLVKKLQVSDNRLALDILQKSVRRFYGQGFYHYSKALPVG